MKVVALTTSFPSTHFEQLAPPPTYVCRDFSEYLADPAAA